MRFAVVYLVYAFRDTICSVVTSVIMEFNSMNFAMKSFGSKASWKWHHCLQPPKASLLPQSNSMWWGDGFCIEFAYAKYFRICSIDFRLLARINLRPDPHRQPTRIPTPNDMAKVLAILPLLKWMIRRVLLSQLSHIVYTCENHPHSASL